MKEIRLKPIGFVKNKQNKDPKRKSWQEIKSKIVLEPEFVGDLNKIEKFSHLVIVYWLDRIFENERKRKKIECFTTSRKFQGIFATRSPFRPNPIGITIVKLIRVYKNVLVVQGLDAFNGTPVLDIKPHIGHFED